MILKRFRSLIPNTKACIKFGLINQGFKGNAGNKINAFNIYHFSELKKIKQAFYDFLNYEAGAVVRNTPKVRERKYKNIQIAKQFKQIEQNRKKERLIYLQKRKLLIQQKLDAQAKLLTQSQKTQYGQELKTLESILQQNQKELTQIQKVLEETGAQFVLLESWKKQIILNKIEYLRYMARHPSGVFLAPNQVQNIENIHYLVVHNLPVNRYKIYQLMPQMFVQEIDELEEAQRKLVKQKYLTLGRNLDSNIQYFLAKQQNREPQDQLSISDLMTQMLQVSTNIYTHISNLFVPHGQFLERVYRKQTIWRNNKHLFTCLLNSQGLNLNKLTKEELALKKTLHQIQKVKEEWQLYRIKTMQLIQQMKTMPSDPPQYIANHPVLLKRWNEVCQRFSQPVQFHQVIKFPPARQNKLEIEIRKYVEQNFNNRFAEIINSSETQQDRKRFHHNLPQNKRLEVQFYKQATNIMQNIAQLQSQQEYFKQLPKNNVKLSREKIQNEQKYIRIQLDQFTKIIHLNNKNKQKYNVQFFSKYFGIQENLLRSALSAVSYLKINVSQELQNQGPTMDRQKANKQITQQIIKFIL